MSPKFKREMVEICGVRGRTKILIHGGNSVYDTDGCVCVGSGCREKIEVIWDCKEIVKLIFNMVKEGSLKSIKIIDAF